MVYYHDNVQCAVKLWNECSVSRKTKFTKIQSKEMWSIVEYLKKPELVVAVQEWFGVEYLESKHEKHIENEDKFYSHSNTPNSVRNRYSNYPEHKKHRRKESDESCVEKSSADNVNGNSDAYRITNKFWYYLFIIGTELGDELFYATMIPFWFWNIDGAVGRRVVFVWSVVMYIGQVLKDIIRWPRPGPPVSRLQNKWSVEYGMPSTHAMVCILFTKFHCLPIKTFGQQNSWIIET